VIEQGQIRANPARVSSLPSRARQSGAPKSDIQPSGLYSISPPPLERAALLHGGGDDTEGMEPIPRPAPLKHRDARSHQACTLDRRRPRDKTTSTGHQELTTPSARRAAAFRKAR
jgi:hypothetical protein